MDQETDAAWVRLFGGAMIAGPLLLLASVVAFVTGGGLNADELGGALMVYALVAMTVVAVGITRALQPSLPRMSAALLGVAVLGCAGGVGFGIDSIHAALPGHAGLEDADSAAAIVALFVPGVLFPLSFAALGVALWRARVDPPLSGLLLVVAAIMFPIANIPDVEIVAVAANAMFVVALAPLGVTWLRRGHIGLRPKAHDNGQSHAASTASTRTAP